MVVSGDRDVYQLVDGRGAGDDDLARGHRHKVYDRKGVIERYGVPPELVTDLIGLKGDTSDNIPGVPGIGDKTAAQLLQEFGSLEEVLANVDKISGAKRKENLTEHAEDARISKQLATAVTDIDFELDLDELMARTMDRGRLREVAREFELRDRPPAPRGGAGRRDFVPEGRSRRSSTSAPSGERSPTSPRARSALAMAVGAPGPPPMASGSSRARPRSSRSLAEALGDRAADRPRHEEPRRRRQHGLLAAVGEGGLRLAPRHDGRRLPARPGAPHVRPGRHRRPARACRHARGRRGRRRRRRAAGAGRGAAARPGAEARLVWEIAQRQRESMKEQGLEKLMDEVEMPLVEVLAEMERVGVKLDAKRLAEIGEGFEQRIDDPAGRDLRARGARVHDRLPPAARRGPLRRARADQEASRQDRLLDRRPRALPDPRRARDRRQGRGAGAS